MQSKNFNKTYKLTLIGILTAIIIIQNFVPFLGYIPIQPFNPTIIHITVIIGAVLLGPFEGMLLGFIWGVVCLFRAYFMPTSPIDPIVFTNPAVSVLPRILIGLVAGYLYKWIKKINVTNLIAYPLCGILGSFINTIFVLGTIYIFYRTPYANFYQMDVSALLPAILGVVFTNGVAEAIAAAILTYSIASPLSLVIKKKSLE